MSWSRGLSKKENLAWMMAGLGLFFSCFGWTVLSEKFNYGQSHFQRPIIELVGLFCLAWLFFVVGAFLLSRTTHTRKKFIWIICISIGVRVILVPSNLIQENDVYRYVLDGQVLLNGENPYRYPPLTISELSERSSLRKELEKPEALTVLSRISYPEIPTLYPPMAQVIFAVGTHISGWNWMGQRLVLMMVDAGVIILLIHLLRALSLSGSWVLLYAWSPLVLKEVVNSVHLDVLVAFFVLLQIRALVEQDRKGRDVWVVLSGVALGLAILSKLYPLLLIPACVFFLCRRPRGYVLSGIFVFAVGVTVVLGFSPFWGVGFDHLSRGLYSYLGEWEMNAGVFTLLSYISPYPRWICGALIALLSFLIPWARKSDDILSLVETMQWVLLLWFLLIPAPFPWYVIPMIALLPIRTGSSAFFFVMLLVSVVAVAYYLSFFFEYRGYSYLWWHITRLVEHGVIWLMLALFSGIPWTLENCRLVFGIEGENFLSKKNR